MLLEAHEFWPTIDAEPNSLELGPLGNALVGALRAQLRTFKTVTFVAHSLGAWLIISPATSTWRGSLERCVGVDQWVRGTVAAHYYREPDWPMQLLAPYRVRLDAASLDNSNEVYIWAPLDSDECIRVLSDGPQIEES